MTGSPEIEEKVIELTERVNDITSNNITIKNSFSFPKIKFLNIWILAPIISLLLLSILRPKFIKDKLTDQYGLDYYKISYKKFILCFILLTSIIYIINIGILSYKNRKLTFF